MTLPLVYYDNIEDYRRHFEMEYCRFGVVTSDGIQVYFRKSKFDHAFFESSNRDGKKDVFSTARAQRIDWIGPTLESSESRLFAGWNKKKRRYEHSSRVALLLQDFVVIIRLNLRTGTLRAEFVTAYYADNSINKICRSPKWDMAECLNELGR